MKTIVRLVPLAFGLAACTTYNDPYYGQGEPYPPQQPYPPAPYPDQGRESYRAIGTEPFWDLNITDQMVFTDRGNNITVAQPTPRPINGTAGEIYRTQRLEVNVTHVRCSDGMSDRTYPDTVQVTVDGRMYRGCGAPTSFYSTVGEDGRPVTPPPAAAPGDSVPLDKTRWRVVSINNRPVPREGNFSMQFADGRLSATLGCNSLGAGYTQIGASLDAGMVMATRMACPDMSWEQQGSAILGDVMTIRMLDRNRVVLNAPSGSIELVRQ